MVATATVRPSSVKSWPPYACRRVGQGPLSIRARVPVYDLLEAFGARTGMPILLNTLNLKGDPMVDTPIDAVAACTPATSARCSGHAPRHPQ